MDDPSKRGNVHGQTMKKSTISDDFWSTSAGEIDDSVLQSPPNFSSISISNQPHDPFGSTSNPSEFVNQGKF